MMQELRASSDALLLDRLEVLSGWTESLRAACDAMALPPPYSPPSIEVGGRLAGGVGEARLLVAVSRELAEEYGLQALVTLQADSFAVRYSRAA